MGTISYPISHVGIRTGRLICGSGITNNEDISERNRMFLSVFYHISESFLCCLFSLLRYIHYSATVEENAELGKPPDGQRRVFLDTFFSL